MQHHNLPQVLKSVLEDGKIREDSPSIDIFDLDHLDARIDDLADAFGDQFILNAFAMKVNPLRGVLRSVRDKGLGVECASIPEVAHALNMGFHPRKVVYGGLCKTKVRSDPFDKKHQWHVCSS